MSLCSIVLRHQDFNHVLRRVTPSLSEIIHNEPHIEYTTNGGSSARETANLGNSGGGSGSNSPKADSTLGGGSNGQNTASTGSSIRPGPHFQPIDRLDKNLDKSKGGGVASRETSERMTKRLPELPKTCKIFQLIVNIEHSLGEHDFFTQSLIHSITDQLSSPPPLYHLRYALPTTNTNRFFRR